MKIFLARDAGYCFGVRDAVNLAYDTAEAKGEVYMLGTIVHNERVIENLANAGAKVVETLDDVPENKSKLDNLLSELENANEEECESCAI